MHITKGAVDKLTFPTKITEGQTAQKRYYDDKLKGFGVRVTSGKTKAFFIEKLIKGKLRRITLGRYPELTVEAARQQAQIFLGQVAQKIDPLAERITAKLQQVTLNDVMTDYLNARKSLKPKTIYDYNRIVNIAFAAWQNKPIISITKDKITRHHEKLGQENGEAYANLAMRVLRALFNFAAGQYEDSEGRSLITDNPVRRLSQTRAWYRVERRQTFIKTHELAVWHNGINGLSNTILSDYLRLILFTGLRRQEAAKLQWKQVDLKAKTLTIIDTKNREQHTLPLSDYLYDLLYNRSQKAASLYVFPGIGAAGHIIEPRKQIVKVIESTGIKFTVHDLRRTFITIAESLDIPAYALKRLLNHKMSQDVTAGYIVMDVERLRKPMQQITDYLLAYMGVKKQADIVTLNHLQQEASDEQTA